MSSEKHPELSRNFQYFLDHQSELVEKYNGKFLLIHGQKVIGAYSEEIEAYMYGKQHFTPGTFLIQKCEPGEDAYSQTFHSRVAFPS